MSTLELKKFDMRKISFDPLKEQGPCVVMIGRRDTGKSFLVRDLLFQHKSVPSGTVISGTEAGNSFYSSHVPRPFIHDEYKTTIIERLLQRQRLCLHKINHEKINLDPRAFCILDDCMYDIKFMIDMCIL